MSDSEPEPELSELHSDDKTVRFVPAKSESERPPPPGTGYKFDESNSRFIASREAAGIWVAGGSAWKVYRKDKTLGKAKKAIKTAQDAGLPLVPIEIIDGQDEQAATGFVFQPVGGQKKTFGFAIKTQYLSDPYVFFSAQGHGVKKFKTFLEGVSDRNVLEGYKSALEIAVDIELSDPQGLVDPNGSILFFDIHTGSSSGAEDLLHEVKARLKKL
ncbi:hypothetical protein HWV62_42701 [Athelia sp. TMB]|nr:hypothetical protein HWV62_42701 [Athelia sp. TMB]